MSLFDQDKSAARMPVSLITGFLGSGKTTLLNRVLGDPRMARSLVLVNEFGEVGLDHLFMESLSGDMVLLQSGCVCCTIQGDLDRRCATSPGAAPTTRRRRSIACCWRPRASPTRRPSCSSC